MTKSDRDALVVSHIEYAERYAVRRMRIAGVLDLEDDVRGAARLGLVRAAAKFDPERGVQFGTYAGWWIRKEVNECIAALKYAVRATKDSDVEAAAMRMGPAERRLLQRLGRTPSNDEVAEEIGAPLRLVERARAAIRPRDGAIDGCDVAGDGYRVPACHGRSPEEQADEVVTQLAINRALASLPEREADIMRRRLCADEPETLEQVGEVYGISRERVRQLQRDYLPMFERALRRELGEGWAA